MNQIDLYYKLKKSDVSYACTYLEAFEGMAAIRTPNPEIGEDTVLHIMVSPDFLSQFESLASELSKEFLFEKTQL